MKKHGYLVLAVSIAVVGCATQPEEISSTYVSPFRYKDYDCEQIFEEMDYTSHRTAALYQSLDKKADDDAAQMGIGLILFWPALFFLEGGDGPQAVEYSNLKGEFEALRQTGVKKKCSSANFPPSPEEIVADAAEKKKAERAATEVENTGFH